MSRQYWSGKQINELKENEVFVFGSNPEGRHGAGAAKAALKFGAKYHKGRGLHGQSYALITKNLTPGFVEKETGIVYEKDSYLSVSKEQIKDNVRELYECARNHPEKDFLVTYQNETWPNGSPKKNLNGYTFKELISIFTEGLEVPDNIVFHESAKMFINQTQNMEQHQQPTNNSAKKYTFFFYLASPFSNFHPSIFNYKDLTFVSNEQFIMYCKAKIFGDDEMAQKIMAVNTQEPLCQQFLSGNISAQNIVKDKEMAKKWNDIMKHVKKCGRDVKGYKEEVWVSKRVNVAGIGAKEKFKQNPDIKKVLLNTEGTYLVEASPYDKIWGIGLNAQDAQNTPKDKWPGLNLLGEQVLDRVRALIIKEDMELNQSHAPKKFKP